MKYVVSRKKDGFWASVQIAKTRKRAVALAVEQSAQAGTVRVHKWPSVLDEYDGAAVLRIQRDGRCYGPWAEQARLKVAS